MDKIIRHWITTDEVDSNTEEIVIPQDAPAHMNVFRDHWRIEPRRLINWRQTFHEHLALDYRDYDYLGDDEVDGDIVHRFVDTERTAGLVSFVQSGDPEAIRQGDVITYVAYVPVLRVRSSGTVLVESEDSAIRRMLKGLNWATNRADIQKFRECLQASPSAKKWTGAAVQAVVECWKDASFLQVMPA